MTARTAVRRLTVSLPPEHPAAALVRGIRVPGAAVVALVLLVLGVLILAPGVSAYLDQRQQVADARAQVAEQRRDLADLTAEHARWSDPAYIRAQAGSRLFYVLPGETVYRVTGSVPAPAVPTAQPPTKTVQQTRVDWVGSLYASLVTAGTTTAPASRLTTALPGR